MKVMWLVHCPFCRHSGTSTLPPDHPEASKIVSCVTCNRDLDATKGTIEIKPTRIKKREEPDLLEIY